MAKLNRKQIEGATRAVLERHPGGGRSAEVLKAVAAHHPETPLNSIHGATHHLFQRGDGIVKIARDTYQLARSAETGNEAAASAPGVGDDVVDCTGAPPERRPSRNSTPAWPNGWRRMTV